MWDGGDSKDGKSSTANFISGRYGSVPPLQEVFKMAGLDLLYYLGQEKDPENPPQGPPVKIVPMEDKSKV